MKLKAVLAKAGDFLDGFLAYVLTIVGILVSQYLPAFTAGQEISLKLGLPRLIISAVIAFTIIAQQETGGDPAGKRAKFSVRMANALNHGLGWSALLHMGGLQ